MDRIAKEKIAKQMVRLIRLIPSTPIGHYIDSTDTQSGITAILLEQKEQELYFRVFDRVLPLVNTYAASDKPPDKLVDAVDIVEMVKNNLANNEASN